MFRLFWSKVPDLNNWSQDISFKVNGKVVKVKNGEVGPEMQLSTFLRTKLNLFGTKFMCMEGGCGACVVSIKRMHPVRLTFDQFSVNSCLYPLLACDGSEIETIEFLKSATTGYHEISQTLAKNGGSQCGYCSSGMVMSLYSLMKKQNGAVSRSEVEKSLGGQLCRCTGYRPILDAFKSLSTEETPKLLHPVLDIEEVPLCKSTGDPCSSKCAPEIVRKCFPQAKSSAGGPVEWRKAASLRDVFDIFSTIGPRKYMLVGGNTAHGVYRRPEDIQVFIDINGVPELKGSSMNVSFEVGGATTITELIESLKSAFRIDPQNFEYLNELVTHLELIGSTSIRNTGTLGGNLTIKHTRNRFASDLFLLLETVGAQVVIARGPRSVDVDSYSPEEFLSVNMNKKVIRKITLPPRDSSLYTLKTYKIMPRAQNASAYVNAGFLLEFQTPQKRLLKSIRICYGGINAMFVHASTAENALIGMDLYANSTLQMALASLETEVNPDSVLPDSSPEFRKRLALDLFYKMVLGTAPMDVAMNPRIFTGGQLLERPMSSGTQTYDTVPKNYPLTQPVMKMEALMQTSGEASYHNDLYHLPEGDDLWCAFVLATEINSLVLGFDTSAALAMEGVVAFYSAKDIPGRNVSVGSPLLFVVEPEEVFVSGRVKYHGQPAGMIVASSYDLAHKAANRVIVQYSTREEVQMKNYLCLDDVLCDEEAKKSRVVLAKYSDVPKASSSETPQDNVNSVNIAGQFEVPFQYHFPMEPQTIICELRDDKMDVLISTQAIDFVQYGLSSVLNWPASKFNIEVRRVGGGFGVKFSRTAFACACALACYLLKKRVRFVMSIEQMMSSIGKRNAGRNEYRVQVSNLGKIERLENEIYSDFGCTLNDDPFPFALGAFINVYDNAAWTNQAFQVVTDLPSSTWARAPGGVEGVAMIENLMEHIAYVTNQDPTQVRMLNLRTNSKLPGMFRDFLVDIDYENRQREIETFNMNNKWRKRGLSVVPKEHHLYYFGCVASLVSIYHIDGTVSICHGSIEMGQGVNTKVCQVAAHVLGIPLDLITTKSHREFVSPNAPPDGGSQGSEIACYGTLKACEELNRRLQPIRDSAPPNTTWQGIVQMAYLQSVDLASRQSWTTGQTQEYDIHGLAACEVEVDVLTGNHLLRRVDILEDTGESMNPLLDLGQVEGGFTMGLGYWLTEKLVISPQNGELLTNRTWNYKIPGALDIPVDFRVKFLQRSPNPFGVLRAKGTGEPATVMAVSALLAIRRAVNAARAENGMTREWYTIPIPCSPDNLLLLMGNQNSDFTL